MHQGFAPDIQGAGRRHLIAGSMQGIGRMKDQATISGGRLLDPRHRRETGETEIGTGIIGEIDFETIRVLIRKSVHTIRTIFLMPDHLPVHHLRTELVHLHFAMPDHSPLKRNRHLHLGYRLAPVEPLRLHPERHREVETIESREEIPIDHLILLRLGRRISQHPELLDLCAVRVHLSIP